MAPPPFPSSAAPPNPQVCKYFLAGQCKYGKNCRFLHIRNPPGNFPPQQQAVNQFPQQQQQPGKTISIEELIRFDLGQVKNVWPFSCYGITTNWSEGGNIIVGEFSPEELRVEAYHQMKTHQNIQNYITQVTQMKAMFEKRKAELIENPKLAQQQQNPISNNPIPDTTAFNTFAHHPEILPTPKLPQPHHIPQLQSNIPSASNQNFEFGKIPEDLPPNRRI